ncbi:TetR/AcrR family transcriptional regulator [Acinetobacter nosocomialis]|uniref:TetR/AcrR family transcriptional regulator n=1 Tax=Acinetobacter baumannii TaxID=470 RepID=A0A837QAF2_ACIBA|nr:MULTISPECIES: TetR/AcrR family transcriptional regulator [Acinetobacter calcoaceticus/baumannii complex]EHU1901186.1 TetR/AcrR family transcriptional regulator [Acinetobacter baumannii]EHU1918292.1 TetR/AcrR family transcriptional regulator [Acinetobacter baumannii]EHU1962225.1 TetR/AcrR family transcriptional regulator [Acinetobacter baumannii]EHU2144012.1 TetR/AcrR family transcriptional regulator [Acinetobacter baumannii]EHU2654027.1 TetR/AcrR family transcriptional regulator [Acinetobac
MTTSRRRPKHDPKESEREILEAAEQFLSEHHFRDLNIDEVMRRTGLKRPAFYVHFRDKNDLTLRLVQNISKELFDIADRWLAGTNHQEDLRRALVDSVNVYVEHGRLLRAFVEAASGDERVDRVYRGLIQDFITAAAQHIKAEQQAGKIKKDVEVEETAKALIWLEERYLSETFGHASQVEPEIVIQVLQNIWISTLYGTN